MTQPDPITNRLPMPPAEFLAAVTMVGERAAAGYGWQEGYLAGRAAAATEEPTAAGLIAEATRWRVVLPAGALKGISEADAYRLAAEHGVRPDRSTVRLYADGTEVLGPWSPAPVVLSARTA